MEGEKEDSERESGKGKEKRRESDDIMEESRLLEIYNPFHFEEKRD